MTAFDTDILSDIWASRQPYLSRAQAIPLSDQAMPLVVAEEVLRGRFNLIRQADAGRATCTLVEAYRRFEESLVAIRGSIILPYTDAAHAFVLGWQSARIRVGSRDMRIAAIALSAGYTLVTRNARDYSRIPGLKLDVW